MIKNTKFIFSAVVVLTAVFLTLGCKQPQQKSATPAPQPQPQPQQQEAVQPPAVAPAPVVAPVQAAEIPAPVAKERTQNFDLKTVYFDYNKASLSESAKATLRSNAKILAKVKYSITVEGYCDNEGSPAYNQKLGAKRALAVKRFYTRMGISKERISAASLGKHNPVSKKDKSLNRRVETIIND